MTWRGFSVSSFEIAIFAITLLVGLLALRIPVAVAMIVVGIGGYVSISGWTALLNYSGSAHVLTDLAPVTASMGKR